jgi:hypothetical protein
VKSVAKILIFLAFLQFFPEFLRPVNKKTKKTSHNLGYARAKRRVWVRIARRMSSKNRAMSQIRD